MKFTFLLADASIEIPPRKIWNHPAIKSDAEKRRRRPDEILLYIPKHRFAIDMLNNATKRGRPDIAHRTLLILLDSPLNRTGLMRILVHTINNEILEFSPKVRLPRDYYQFEGLMVQLLKIGRVPSKGEPLIWKLNTNVNSLLKDNYVVLLSEKGDRLSLDSLREIIEKNPLIAVGAFQKGKFSEIYYQYANEIYRLGDYILMTSNIVCKLVTMIELCIGIL